MKRTTRQLVFELLDREGYLGTGVIANRLRIPHGTASSSKAAWKKARGKPVGTQLNPIRNIDGSKTLGQCIFIILDEEPHLKPREIAGRLGITTLQANSAWQRWKKVQGTNRPAPPRSSIKRAIPIQEQIDTFINSEEKRRTTMKKKFNTYPEQLYTELNQKLASAQLATDINDVVAFIKENYSNLSVPRGTVHSWLFNFKLAGNIRISGKRIVATSPIVSEEPKSPTPTGKLTPTASDIADALLEQAVKAIDKGNFSDGQLAAAKKHIASLHQDNKRLAEEVTRILKIHNEQVSLRDNKLLASVGDIGAIMKRAKLRD